MFPQEIILHIAHHTDPQTAARLLSTARYPWTVATCIRVDFEYNEDENSQVITAMVGEFVARLTIGKNDQCLQILSPNGSTVYIAGNTMYVISVGSNREIAEFRRIRGKIHQLYAGVTTLGPHTSLPADIWKPAELPSYVQHHLAAAKTLLQRYNSHDSDG